MNGMERVGTCSKAFETYKGSLSLNYIMDSRVATLNSAFGQVLPSRRTS